jgi:hypothetical protein
MNQSAILVAFGVLSSGLSAQEALPAGMTLPVALTSPLNSAKARPDDLIRARVMQAVSVTPGVTIPAGTEILGRVLETQPDEGTGWRISIRFDRILAKGHEISAMTGLRALASLGELREAQLPLTGSEEHFANSAPTRQVGGDITYGTGGPVIEFGPEVGGIVLAGGTVIGRGTPDGAVARLSTLPGSACGAGSPDTSQLQSVWLFSASACGAYGFWNLTIQRSGMTSPRGIIVLRTSSKRVKLPRGTGLLLQTVDDSR